MPHAMVKGRHAFCVPQQIDSVRRSQTGDSFLQYFLRKALLRALASGDLGVFPRNSPT